MSVDVPSLALNSSSATNDPQSLCTSHNSFDEAAQRVINTYRCAIMQGQTAFADSLFSQTLLDEIENKCSHTLPDDLILRPLRRSDCDNGYLELLSQLTVVGDVSKAQFQHRFDVMKSNDSYFICVVASRESGRVVASATLVLEWKFIHACGFRGRIEDIVVDTTMRGRKLGNLIVERVAALGKYLGCYKLSLECKDHLVGFYEKAAGFKVDVGNNYMQLRFDNTVRSTPIPSVVDLKRLSITEEPSPINVPENDNACEKL